MKTYKHDTELMINTRSVFGEERKSTPVQDVTTTSAQINHTPAGLHVGGKHISPGGMGTRTITGGCTHIHTKDLLVSLTCACILVALSHQAGKEWTHCEWNPAPLRLFYTFNSPFLISQISLITEL